MKPDPAIDEIYAVRRKISAEFGHAPRRLMAHYTEYEKQLEREGYRFAAAPVENPEAVMALNDQPAKQ
jgi:hypothetical protein